MSRWLALLAAAAVASERHAASEHLRLQAHPEHEAKLREGAIEKVGDSKYDAGKVNLSSASSKSCAIDPQEMKHIDGFTDGPRQKMFDALTGLLVGYPADPETHVHKGPRTEHHPRTGLPKVAGKMDMRKAGSLKAQQGDDTKYFQHTGWAKSEAARVNACLHCLLTDTTKLLTENNIRYVIADGTLLGATRTGKVIDWDDDLDLRVYPDDWQVFRSVLAKAAEEQGVETVQYKGIRFDARQGKKPDIQAVCTNSECNCDTPSTCPHADVVDVSYKNDVWPDESNLFDGALRTCEFATADGSAVEVSAPSVQATIHGLAKRYNDQWRSDDGQHERWR